MPNPTELVGQTAYDNAPIGTLVERGAGDGLVKHTDGLWYDSDQHGTITGRHGMQELNARRRIVRWGTMRTHIEGEQAYIDAPVGTQLVYYNDDRILEKTGINEWVIYLNGVEQSRHNDFDWSDRRDVIRWGLAGLDEAAPQFTVGQVLTTVAELDALPVGTWLNSEANPVQHHHKLAHNQWQEHRDADCDSSIDGCISTSEHVLGLSYRRQRTIRRLPDPFTVGQQLHSMAELGALPVGTVVAFNYNADLNSALLNGEKRIKRADGWRQLRSDTPSPVSGFTDNMDQGRWFIAELPDEQPTVDLTPGRRLYTEADLDALPDGTRLCFHATGNFQLAQEATRGTRAEKVNGQWLYINRNTERVNGEPCTGWSELSRGAWMVLHGPQGQPSSPASLRVGQEVGTVEEYEQLPVGTRVTRINDRAGWWEKTSRGWVEYQRDGTEMSGMIRDSDHLRSITPASQARTIVSLPEGVTATADGLRPVHERVQQAKDDVEQAINECVAGNGHAYAKDGAFWVLGISNPPAVGEQVYFGSAFGLPIGSLVGREGTVWRVVSHDERYPEHLAGPQRHVARDEYVNLIALGESETVEFTGYNHFLHTVWERERQMREWHQWCTAVEDCLTDHELTDPGDTPDEATFTPVQLVVGARFIDRPTVPEKRAFNELPLGSIITTGTSEPFVKTVQGWYSTRFTRVDDSVLDCGDITIHYIHTV